MKSERAEAYINANEMDAAYLVDKDGCGWAVIGIHQARKAVELAEQEAEERVYEKLTRWNDPKNRPPYGLWVLMKVFRIGGEPIYAGSFELGNVWVTEGGSVFTDDAENDDEYVVGGYYNITFPKHTITMIYTP